MPTAWSNSIASRQGRAPRRRAVDADRLHELVADGEDWAQGCERILHHQRHVTAAHALERLVVVRVEVVAVEADAVGPHLAGGIDQPEHAEQRERLAGPRFADDGEALAGKHG